MKHLLNDLTEQEKRSILSQHKGSIKVVTESFFKNINAKSGNVKPLLEQSTAPVPTPTQEPTPNQDLLKQRLDQLIAELKKIPYYQKEDTYGIKDDILYLDMEPYGDDEEEVIKWSYYSGGGSCGRSNFVRVSNDKEIGYHFCGRCVRGCSMNLDLAGVMKEIKQYVPGGYVEPPLATYTTSNFQELAKEIIESSTPRTNMVGGKGSFKMKNGNTYAYDFSNVLKSNMENVIFFSDTSQNNVYKVPDMKENSVWIGFGNSDATGTNATIIYVNKKDKVRTGQFVR